MSETPSPAPVETPPAPEASPAPRRRLWRLAVVVGFLLLTGAGLAAWRYVVTRPDYLFRRAQKLIEAQAARPPRDRDYNDVWEIAERLAEVGETDRAELLRGEALFAQGQFALALERFNKVREDPALKVRAALFQGRCLLEVQQHREANHVLTWALEQAPDDVDGHRAMAALAYDLGQMGRARHHLGRVAELAPDDGRPYRLLGLIAKFAADNDTALKYYQEALKRDLTEAFRAEVYLELAEVYHEMKKPAETLQALDQHAALTPAPPAQAANLRATALWRLNKPAEARAVVARAVEQHPKEAELWVLKGELELQADRDPKRAVTSLEEAVRLAPSIYRAQHLLGRAYAGAGRPEDARRANARAEDVRKKLHQVDDLSRQAMARPWDAAVRTSLAELWDQMGNRKLAEMWYRAAQACK